MRFENRRASSIQLSASMVVSMAARALRAQGRQIVDLSLGEPDFNTPDNVIEAAIRAMRDGVTHYTGPSGLPQLREAIVAKLARENGLDYTPEQISIGVGAKQILFNLFMGVLESGDEVIIPAPFWVSYRDMVEFNGGRAVVLPCGLESGFRLTPSQLAAAITPATRWVMLNTPSNPSGAVYSRAELQALGQVLAAHPQIGIISDEIYEHILFGDTPFVSFAAACPELKDRTILINGVSKAYAMTGWRLGYAAAPPGFARMLNKMESQVSTCPSSISQVAAAEAMDGPQDFLHMAGAAYARRLAIVMEGLAGIEGLKVCKPAGAFYVFPECSAFIGRRTPDGRRIENDVMLAEYLLHEGGVATVPGAAFGLEPYIRLSFATSEEQLRIAMAAMTRTLGLLEQE
ncbi:pyridoxal phosphate-dependent aminotransferase [Komagataeibacter sp. SM21]|uniref:pyridoxal phosphate-dependent aminotransferase n=1 Tax=Komagataeibacter sp. SM21 TaxID=3242899 RepID=UPI003529B114